MLRGKKNIAADFLQNAQDLCGRYFVEQFNIVKFVIKPSKNQALLADFVKMYYTDESVAGVLDQKIRRLPLSLDSDLDVSVNDAQAFQVQKPSFVLAKQAQVQNEHKTPKATKLEAPDNKIKPPSPENKPLLIEKKLPQEKAINKNVNKTINKKIDKSINIDKKLQDIFRSEQIERQGKRFSKNLKGAHKIVEKSKYRRLSFYIGVLLATFGCLILIIFANFYLTQKSLKKIY